MPVVFDTDAKELLKKHGPTLERREAEHNLILSLCQMALAKEAKGEASGISIATLMDDDGLVARSRREWCHLLRQSDQSSGSRRRSLAFRRRTLGRKR